MNSIDNDLFGQGSKHNVFVCNASLKSLYAVGSMNSIENDLFGPGSKRSVILQCLVVFFYVVGSFKAL